MYTGGTSFFLLLIFTLLTTTDQYLLTICTLFVSLQGLSTLAKKGFVLSCLHGQDVSS